MRVQEGAKEKVTLPELNKIYVGDCLEVMKMWTDNFIDTIIADPPYGLKFMGKDWDGDVPGIPFWTEMLRICKPGATLLSFGGTRTWHHLAIAIEKAGWVIRDTLMWLYGSGFPKSHNLHGEFEGYGTALKPAWEPIIMAMKPCEGTFAENAEKWEVAGLNINGGRIDGKLEGDPNRFSKAYSMGNGHEGWKRPSHENYRPPVVRTEGRWPSNLLLDEEAAGMLDGQSGNTKSGDLIGQPRVENKIYGSAANTIGTPRFHNGDSGGASRFFYVAKADRAERNEGCDEMPFVISREYRTGNIQKDGHRTPDKVAKNFHPTVKPLDLMKYLCNLTRTPTGGVVLDPFAGSGTTLWAAESHNRPWLGIEINPEYIKIAEARIANEKAQLKFA